MAALPDEVAATIAKAQIVPDEQEHHDPFIKRVFGKLAKLLAQATETDEVKSADEDNQTEGKATATCNDGTAYGYPPAYGVPASVAVQLLYDTSKLLEKLLDEVSDDELSSEIKELKERIAQALGINAQEFVAPVDVFREMRLAVTVSLGTQPVLPAAEAAERLKNAWNGFAQVVTQGEYALPVGKMFDATFALRAAVEAAIKSLGAMAMAAKLQENESAAETEDNAAGNQDAEQSAQASEASQVAGSDQAVVAEGQPNETIMEASDSGNNELAASSSQESAPAMFDDRLASILQEAIAPIVGRIEELMQRIEAVESAIKTRRRVSSFAASSSKKDNEEDLWRRWLSASDRERKVLIREAQKLLAAPIPIDRD
jgi:nucleotide-binding universal stress UspA family protein